MRLNALFHCNADIGVYFPGDSTLRKIIKTDSLALMFAELVDSVSAHSDDARTQRVNKRARVCLLR